MQKKLLDGADIETWSTPRVTAMRKDLLAPHHHTACPPISPTIRYLHHTPHHYTACPPSISHTIRYLLHTPHHHKPCPYKGKPHNKMIYYTLYNYYLFIYIDIAI